MVADPNLLILAEPWRKGTRSGGTSCVEAARVTAADTPLTDTTAVQEAKIAE
jgi:hypothetical protein